ncbi:hypothetical protein MJO28_017449 [Puccinia striiformis f. sp. tritici]|uniref:Uncharacterized protein n=1 Tax=Puccinia striiformis TaxID=27350 RepID=A0A2S4V7P5_9BASI|nr:hypothetical protein MJO28_017449 [Puccinia striiformis f. sp. tritici]POW05480.1 hypothetical protein PSTT_09691 [Puccinia striiformis]
MHSPRDFERSLKRSIKPSELAAFSLAEVTYTSRNDIGYQLQESVKEATFKVSTHQENVSGVILPTFAVD